MSPLIFLNFLFNLGWCDLWFTLFVLVVYTTIVIASLTAVILLLDGGNAYHFWSVCYTSVNLKLWRLCAICNTNDKWTDLSKVINWNIHLNSKSCDKSNQCEKFCHGNKFVLLCSLCFQCWCTCEYSRLNERGTCTVCYL